MNQRFKAERWSGGGRKIEYKVFLMKHCAIILTLRSRLTQQQTDFIEEF